MQLVKFVLQRITDRRGPHVSQLAQGTEGGTLLEFALTAVLLFTVLFAIIDFSLAVYMDHHLADAARSGARYAMVRGSSWGKSCASVNSFSCSASASNITTYVKSLTPPGMSSNKLTVETKWIGTGTAGSKCDSTSTNTSTCFYSSVSVTVRYPFSFISPFFNMSGKQLSATSVMPLAQ